MRSLNKLAFLPVLLYMFLFLEGDTKTPTQYSETEKEYKYLSLFSEVVSLVKTNYVEAVDAASKFPGAFSAMLGSLDPFSAYLDATKTETYRHYKKGTPHGCGIYGAKVFNYFYITDVTPGSPAEKAGIKPGDTIKAANGESFYAASFWEMYLSLMTTKPKTIEVVLFEKNRRDTKKIKLDTRAIEPKTTIRPLPKQKDILLVNLTRFDADAADRLEKRLTHLRNIRGEKPLKLIVDLRKYSGGDFNAFREIVNLFFKKPLLLTLKLKNKEEDFLLGAEKTIKYKAAVILNRSTRMYAELMAALFRNSGAPAQRPAMLVGTKTQGFVAKLKPIPMEDGSSILLTEGFFLLDGKSTASNGVNPDIIIKDDEAGKIMDQCISILSPKTETGKNDKKKTKTQ